MKWSGIMFKTNKQAFTLVELLVVVAIIAVLAALAIPAISSASLKAKQSATASKLKGIGVALNLYVGENDGRLPGPVTFAILPTARNPSTSSDTPHLGGLPCPLSWAPDQLQPNYLQSPSKPSSLQGGSEQYKSATCAIRYFDLNLHQPVGGQSALGYW